MCELDQCNRRQLRQDVVCAIGGSDMPEDMITVRLRRDHATFLDENLTRMAERTRDVMSSPCLPKERRNALYSRAILLEYVDDAIRAALAESADNSL